MLTRKQPPHKPKLSSAVRDCALFTLSDLAPEVRGAREALAAKGWSYRRAAKRLNVHHMHLTHVLTGRRQSLRLCTRILQLPVSKGLQS